MPFRHYLPREIPEPLHGLTDLALDLRWSWHHGTDDLWRSVDSSLWEATENPWLLLETVSDERLTSLATNPSFLGRLQTQLDARQEHLDSPAWFATAGAASFDGSVAYFSMEFALGEALPIYSGGLGVLAGDHMKTACDLDVPVTGIGLLYQQGYFRQAIDASGRQIEFYPYSDPTMLPIVPLRGRRGEWVRVEIPFPGRDVRLRAWHAQVGRRTLLLLDSNDPLNNAGDQGITSELYGGGSELRLQQEIALGIGGWKLIEMLGMDCPVCHINEGHAAFAILERARSFMRSSKQSFAVALRATRAGNLFTTHTPVDAGFDRYPPDLFAQYFQGYADGLGIELDELLALGRADASDGSEPFNMAYLAVRGAGAVNGVSRIHGEVSRRLLQRLFPRLSHLEVPVDHVTNGVHMPTWDSAAADAVWTRACGKSRWLGELDALGAGLSGLDNATLWSLRQTGRRRLVEFVRRRLARQSSRRGSGAPAAGSCLDPDVLTIGFARRFAEYKRPNMLLRDAERLARLLRNRDRPVQLVIAGKAHPEDRVGKQMIYAWHEFLQRDDVAGRAVFIEDYDLMVAAELTRGVDLWLNTPRSPWEACGTSGMKTLVNGGLNLSQLDGWWAEAYDPGVGWALGDKADHAEARNRNAADAADAEKLYALLESEIIPCFYERDENGLPCAWIERMRASMARLTTRFSSNRMLREYTERYYAPLAERVRRRGAETAAELEEWHAQLADNWPAIRFGNVSTLRIDATFRFEVEVYLHDLSPEAVAVELYAEPEDGPSPERHRLSWAGKLTGTEGGHLFVGAAPSRRPITDYTPRVVPAHRSANIPLEVSFVLWHH